VGTKYSDDPDVVRIPNEEILHSRPWFRFWRRAHAGLGALAKRNVPGVGRINRKVVWELAQPGKWYDRAHGIDDLRQPGTWRLLGLRPGLPDVVHCHNLHGDYFDLRVLPWLSRRVPVVLSLHDAWLLAGYCCHSFDCERWKVGCGQCPFLDPAVDGTAYNWRRKRNVFAKSRLHVVTACRWLMRKVEESILAPGVVGAHIIPSGVDLSVFRPADKRAVRDELGIPQDARVVLFVAQALQANRCKDYPTFRAAVDLVARRLPGSRLLFLVRGGEAPTQQVGSAEVRFSPFLTDCSGVMRYYQAADVYLHAANVDTFPNSILEAMACGTPVVGAAVGGIPEQIKSQRGAPGAAQGKVYDADEATGIIVPPKDPEAIAAALLQLLGEASLSHRLSENALRDVRQRFGLQRQVDDFLRLYGELAAGGQPRKQGPDRG
jgi:glycosyltransferase involved in cell wall biosynthesis